MPSIWPRRRSRTRRASTHSTGYALDIQGDNGAIKSTCKGHGTTLVFDEKSHVHVEFADGVA
jgi:hypothetical protein